MVIRKAMRTLWLGVGLATASCGWILGFDDLGVRDGGTSVPDATDAGDASLLFDSKSDAPLAPGDAGDTLDLSFGTNGKTVTAIGDSSVVSTGPAASGTESRASGPQKGAIYRIAADGDWTTVWDSPEDVPYDVLVEPGGTLLVATGAKGKLYRLSGDPVLATLVTRADAQQITALAEDGAGGIVLAASNPGRHRVRSISSIRSRNRPPFSRARSKFSNAE
jgi:hypothetical protein